MIDRKFIYILLLTVVVGSAVTLGTGFLTGSLNRLGQVTVKLAGDLDQKETGDTGGPAARMSEKIPDGNETQQTEEQEPLMREKIAEITTAAELLPQSGEGNAPKDPAADMTGQDAAEDVPYVVQDEAMEAALADSGELSAVTVQAGDGASADAEISEETAAGQGEAAAYVYISESSDGVSLKDDSAIYSKSNVQQVAFSPLETTAAEYDAPMAAAAEEAAGLDGGAFLEENPYYIRLTELDTQIQKSREVQNSANTAGAGSNSLAKNAASNELKLWDSELNTIYNEILKSLDEKQTQELVAAERQWMKNRDAEAVEAAKNSAGGSLESMEYTASQAETTRARVYELVRMYGYLLTE